MQKLKLTLTLALLLAVGLLSTPAGAQVSADITLTHKGTGAQFLAQSREFVKQHLGVVNDRTDGKANPAFPADPNAPERIRWTVADVDQASAARITKGVAIILQDYFETTSREWAVDVAVRQADADVVDPVRGRADLTAVGSDFE